MINSLPKWMASTIKFWMSLTFKNSLPNMDDHSNPILDVYVLHLKIPIQNCMTNTIQFCMDTMLNIMFPKMDAQYNPILDVY